MAHFFVFPQETRCILIDFANFKKQQNIYYRKEVSPATIQHLIQTKSAAEKKVINFWKEAASIRYKLIYCASGSDYKNYGQEGVPAVTNIKLGAYVVIPKDIIDVNILSHEISHTVLYRNIGWWKWHFTIPTWFDEGLAMQVDDRDYYNLDTLLQKNRAGIILPDVTQMTTPEKFYSGTKAQVMLNYAVAKYVVHDWLKKNALKNFIESINKGNSFEKSYFIN